MPDRELVSLKKSWHEVDALYNLYAKSRGLNFASILVLQLLHESEEEYTQKRLCEKLGLPKQFINAIIKAFWEQGYVTLKEAKDRRNKELSLTKKGRAFALDMLKPLIDAEDAMWESFSPEEISLLAKMLARYTKALEDAVR